MSDVTRTNISLTSDTLERLDQYAFQNHMNRSQAITKLVWDAKVINPQLRGQMSVDDFVGSSKSTRRNKGAM